MILSLYIYIVGRVGYKVLKSNNKAGMLSFNDVKMSDYLIILRIMHIFHKLN